ncbi:hypothetical protein PV11_10027 [Exophiala sideris]|uniref:Uncharacterized protein n=1 Tax=Exophiala sideris TaxID=1016849 RepID=A0A0D1YTS2_9EURO|nr:hypothetical protein PV11_10027 [Exophiala sideris]
MYNPQSSNRFYANYEQGLQNSSDRTYKPSKPSPLSSASSSRTTSAVSLQPLQPTEDIAEWAHGIHVIQNRKYEWCQSCHQKPTTIQVPSEKILQQHRMNNQPGHAYQ